MMQRIFIAIDLPKAVKAVVSRNLGAFKDKVPPEARRAMRLIPDANWHLTLSFLGDQDGDSVRRIVAVTGRCVAAASRGEVVFTRIAYGPPGKQPRMIWLVADDETSRALALLGDALEAGFEEEKINFRRESRKFAGHVTLARSRRDRGGDFSLPAGRQARVWQAADCRFAPEAIDVMASTLHREGPEYDLLQRFSFLSGKN